VPTRYEAVNKVDCGGYYWRIQDPGVKGELKRWGEWDRKQVWRGGCALVGTFPKSGLNGVPIFGPKDHRSRLLLVAQ